jgi:hypothetical protein
MTNLNLFKKKEVWVITVKGWLVIGLISMIIISGFAETVHPFFAISDPKRGEILVVEGWLPRYAIDKAVREFKENAYRLIITTGGPIYSQLPCSDYKNYADLASAVLKDLKVEPEKIVSVPAPDVKKDRTYVSALILKRWLTQNMPEAKSLDLVSLGVHARRSLILYQMALGSNISVGVISVPNQGYDPNRWWRYSQGVKTIINEVIGYVYTKFIFRPERVLPA